MFSYIVWAAVFLVVFHLFVFHEYKWPSYSRLINKIPGPSGLFYLGSMFDFYRLKTEEMLPEFIREFKKYGSTFRHWYSGHPAVFISDLDDIQVVLGSRLNSSKGIMYKHVLPWLGTGLLTSSGEKWHKMRKIITPTFHFSVLHGYISIFNENAKALTDVLMKEVREEEEVDLAKYITYCTLDNVCETAMGVRLNTLTTGEEHSYVEAIFHVGKILVRRIFSLAIFNDLNFNLSPVGWRFSRLLKTLHGFTTKIIEEKRLELSKNGNRNAVTNDSSKKSFLEMLLESQATHNLTNESIREEVDTFMFEGHDTTATALSWALFELGHHMDVQDKMYEEVTQILGDSDRSPTYQDLMDMTYTKRVIQEVLRLYPSVPVIARKFDVDIQIKNYLVPANTDFVLMLYYIHRNPEVFPEPDKFDPDRFLPEEVEARHPFAYIPFSAGPRNCIGQKFAMLELLVVLSSIVRKYRIVSLDDRKSVKVVPEMILRPSEKLRWRIMKR